MPFSKDSIRELRTRTGMTHQELANEIGCTPQTLFNLQKGHAPSIRILDSLHSFCDKNKLEPKPVFYQEPR